MTKKIILVIIIGLFLTVKANAQQIQNAGWFAIFNSTKFNQKWGMHFDVQVRSSDEWQYTRNLLVRPGITYYINQSSNATLGYLFTQTYLPTDILIGAAPQTTLTEHRVWQQYIYNQKPWKGATLSHRLRLEQRFIETQTADLFAQRLRYFVRLLQPLQAHKGVFAKGMFAAFQNELFFNVQNKDKLNGSLFDQNRAYLAIGYRFSPKIDVETGYLNQATHGLTTNTINNVVQLAFYTRF